MASHDLVHLGDPYRLPRHVLPSRYDVMLRPSIDDAVFSGEVTIRLDIEYHADTIVLNAIELDILEVTVDGKAASWRLDAQTERLVVDVPSTLTPPSAKLFIRFTGILNDKLRGFYRSTYVDDAGTEHVIAATQMQATDCRRAFPCWDEPDFKAVFAVTLDVAQGLTAISNGPEISRLDVEGRTIIQFADTMRMSSYLVAFVVGDMEVTDPVDVDGIPLRIVHVPGKAGLTKFGLEVGAFCLRWFQSYYGIPYPSDKVDLVALPDFAAGAMENLGCITFRESLVLIDPGTSTQHERQMVADVVAHELAHMWFGDLVTMRWWNGIWLNEAFATFMEIAACDVFAPDWLRWTNFGLERSVAFDTDSLASTRSVEFEVRSPADCEGMFDVLTYQKGGALLRMLEQYLGPEQFREGVTHYLRAHSYANTETNDLWDAIETTSGEPVRRIMDSWIWQPGFPLLTAETTDSGGRTSLVLTQRRFAYPTATPAVDDAQTAWVIPVHVRNGGVVSTVLIDTTDPVVVELDEPDGVVVVNAGGHGFYRVAYDPALRARLVDPDAMTRLATLERYSLIDDAWAATVAGRITASELLDFLDAFVGEREYGVWQAVTIALGGLSRLAEREALDAFRTHVRQLVAPALAALGSPAQDEPDLTAKLRGLLTRTMGSLGHDEDTIARCRNLFERHRSGEAIDAEMLAAATTVVAVHGNADDYDTMLAGFTHASTPQDQLRHLYALAEFNDPALITRTCEFAMSDAVRTQNAPFLLRTAIANRHQGRRAWEFVRDRWEEAVDRFPNNTHGRMIDSVKLLTAPEVVADVQSFFAAHPIEQAAKTLEQILESQRVNAAFRDRDAAAFESMLLAEST